MLQNYIYKNACKKVRKLEKHLGQTHKTTCIYVEKAGRKVWKK